MQLGFDVAAFFIDSLILAALLLYRTYPTKENRIFFVLLIISLGSAALDIAFGYSVSYFLRYTVSVTWVSVIHFAVANAFAPVYCYFCYVAVHKAKPLDTKEKLYFLVPNAIVLLFIVTTPITGFIFSYNREVYARGSGQIILYVNAVSYLLAGSFFLYHTKLSKFSTAALFVFEALFIALQGIFPYVRLHELGKAMVLFFLYLTLQNPFELRDHFIGSYNRRAFEKIIAFFISEKKPFSIILVRVHGFKYLNSKFGMEKADYLLQQIARYFIGQSRSNLVFNITATQFAILVPDCKKSTEFMNEILERFKQPFYIGETEIVLWATAFYFNYPEHVTYYNDIMNTIDYIGSVASNTQYNVAVHGENELMERRKREITIEHAIAYAVQKKLFDVYYQPIYSVREKKYVSAEALVRLNDADLGFIEPDEFIPVAEKNGAILAIDEIVLEKVCRFIKEFNPVQYGIRKMHVNLPVVHSMTTDGMNRLFRIISRYGIDPHMIDFEITESMTAGNQQQLATMMRLITQYGINFVLDDYGTGYSNATSIIEYDYHMIKIDKSFVWSAQKNEKSAIALKSIITMIRNLGIHVLAEGIETDAQKDLLIEYGCEYFQGYYYSRPVPADTFLKIIAEKHTEEY